MKISARNNFKGTVVAIQKGAINDEIDIVLDGSTTRLTSVITSASTKRLGLETGKKVVAVFKASWVVVMTDAEGVKFSARNNFEGTVVSIKEGQVSTEVRVRLDGGEVLTAVITDTSTKELGIEAGARVIALVKASNVIIGAVE